MIDVLNYFPCGEAKRLFKESQDPDLACLC